MFPRLINIGKKPKTEYFDRGTHVPEEVLRPEGLREGFSIDRAGLLFYTWFS